MRSIVFFFLVGCGSSYEAGCGFVSDFAWEQGRQMATECRDEEPTFMCEANEPDWQLGCQNCAEDSYWAGFEAAWDPTLCN